MSEYDVGVVLHVNDHGAAVFEKNRYATGKHDLECLAFEQRVNH